ncbi:phosphonate C-P lyase system protein PhnH [Reyranella sp. CPCC 100927]|uniref:phosphonate C-P lyase system protein PhnH n=1 Tax=Reyranella sp. CPCC 100927 TaxID=2599616 RepID=UPI0011B490B7|nr:phosphonate C-P lyase system protein PhnH [Reyranella sp. CPCC 100927]TWS95149.1 phosphonate C-P lyase system protein PhnH [Reyranella sp. CPCC 100927]
MTTAALPGFADNVHDAQGTFRRLLDAMAHPGRIVTVPGPQAAPPGLDPATAALLLTLCDGETPVWLDPGAAAIADWLAFHAGAPVTTAPARAAFAVVLQPQAMPALDAFDWGTDEVPEASTTLIVQVASLADDTGWTLRGPGIAAQARLAVAGLSQNWFTDRRAMQAAFPRGVDVVFTNGHRVAALPRTTIMES